MKNAKAELRSSAYDESEPQNILGTGAANMSAPGPPGSNKITPAMQQLLNDKVDAIYVDRMLDLKASKNDAEIALKKLDVLQK